MGTERVTRCCTRLVCGTGVSLGSLLQGFVVAGCFCCLFSAPQPPSSCNSLFKETSLGCADLSTAAICRDTTRSSSTSLLTDWTVVGNGHSLHWQIASAPKILPTEQTRVVSLLLLHPYVCGGEAIQTVTFWGRDRVLWFFHTAFGAVLWWVSVTAFVCVSYWAFYQ